MSKWESNLNKKNPVRDTFNSMIVISYYNKYQELFGFVLGIVLQILLCGDVTMPM